MFIMFTRTPIIALFLGIFLILSDLASAATMGRRTKPLKQATRTSVIRRAIGQPARREVSAVAAPPVTMCGSLAAGVPFSLITTCATTVSTNYCQKALVRSSFGTVFTASGDSTTTIPNLVLNSACGLQTLTAPVNSAIYDQSATAPSAYVYFLSSSQGFVAGTCTVSSAHLLSCVANNGAQSDPRLLSLYNGDGSFIFANPTAGSQIKTGFQVRV